MSYGVDLAALFRDMADYVDRIAKGGKPADLPIEDATRFHMAINLKAPCAWAFRCRTHSPPVPTR